MTATATSRRALLALSGALVTAQAGTPPQAHGADGPDRDLVTACNSFRSLFMAYCSATMADNDDNLADALRERLHADLDAARDRLCTLVTFIATTPAAAPDGIRAKAIALGLYQASLPPSEHAWDRCISASLVRDIACANAGGAWDVAIRG